jgi:hypothetical protein
MQKLSLGWANLPDDHIALVFDNPTWQVFQMIAEHRGTNAKAMILEAIGELLGTVVMTPRNPN